MSKTRTGSEKSATRFPSDSSVRKVPSLRTASQRSVRRKSSEKHLTCTFETLQNLSLEKFCSKKLFQIELLTHLTLKDVLFKEEIIKIGKNYEHLSDVHFITIEDILDLLERLVKKDPVDLPKYIRECAENVLIPKLEQMVTLHLEVLALIIKLKIIESMYSEYKTEVMKMERGHQIQQELNSLLTNCEAKEEDGNNKKKKKGKEGKKGEKGKSKKGNKSEKKSKKSKKSKGSKISVKQPIRTEVVIDDYTDIILEGNDVIFDYNIDNHAVYFVLVGFQDPLLLQELSKISTQVSAVIDVALDSSDPEEPTPFVLKLHEMFETSGTSEYLENTAWLKYRSDGLSPMKEILEEFLYVVKKINYFKRQHLTYIKNLKLSNLGSTPKKLDVDCIDKYRRIMNSYPTELINVPLIVGALIEEICWRELGSVYSDSDLTPSSESEEPRREPKSFQAHEEDALKMGIKTYGEAGRSCYDNSLRYLKLLRLFSTIEVPSKRSYQNRAVSTEDTCYCKNQTELFDYFHLAIFSQMKREEFVPKEPLEYEFTENLVTHDQVKEYQKALHKGLIPTKAKSSEIIENYHMKEDISLAVLYQMVYKAAMEYTCCDRYHCDESKSTLLRFHDNLNEFGIDTKIWFENIPTPVCLRDFCRFITNEAKAWLEEHQLIEHEDLNDSSEECEGLKDMHVPEVYQEYQYLLGAHTGVSHEEKKRVFDEAWNELISYPRSDSLHNFCSDSGTILVHDLGPKLCQLTGHTTIFHSDDGVKVTIDTTRFMSEDSKCTLTVDADGNALVFHSKRPSAFHCILKDETLISFIEPDQTTQEVPTPPEEQSSIEDQSIFGEDEEVPEPKIPNYNDHWIQVLRKSKITAAIRNFSQKTPISDMKVKLDDKNLYRLLELFKAAVYMQHPIYKITTKPSIRHLRRTDSPLHLPFVSNLKRVLFKPLQKKRKIGGYSVLNVARRKRKILLKYDFKITLPHGLAVERLPRNRELAEIKQEYKFSHYKEQYRIFYTSGVVLVKHFDGTTVILRSNGDIIKLSDQSDCYSLNCGKNMAQVFREEEERICPYRTSRCPESPKEKVRTEFVNLYEFGDIPYTKKTLLEFEGKRIYVSDGKVTEKQLYYVTTEHDYHADEVFYEREDGMKCIVDGKGKRTFQFPDGTKITSWPEMEKELINVMDNPKIEGWVSILVNYKFEHPDYITVMYDQTNRATELFLKDAVIKNTEESFIMTANTNIALEVTSSAITFLKTCHLCDSDCVSKIHLEKNPKLLEVCDSYNKYLTCDHRGNCETNTNFIETDLNKNKCDHHWSSEKQKLFIINDRGSRGTLLWKDSSVEYKFESATNSKNVKVSNFMNKLIKKQTLQFFTEIHQSLIGRFTATNLHDTCLSKYKQASTEQPALRYVLYRILEECQNLSQESEIMVDLGDFMENRMGPDLMDGLNELLDYATHAKSRELDTLSYRLSIQESQESSTSSSSGTKSIDFNKPNVKDIIDKWRSECGKYRHYIRNHIFPPYFRSEYYQNVLGTIKAT